MRFVDQLLNFQHALNFKSLVNLELQKNKLMVSHYTSFYKDFYRMTCGYIPLWPFKTEADIGDLFVIRFGQMIKVGNICDKYFGVYDQINIEDNWQTLYDSWSIQSGISHSFKLKKPDNFFCNPCEQPGLKIEFDSIGAYFFDAPKVSHRSIKNFYDFKFKLLQELASEKFSFKEIFVVTSIAQVETYSLLIASGNDATALVSAKEEKDIPRDLKDLTKDKFKGEIQDMKSIHVAHISDKGGQMFFKAQKMEASHQGKEIVRNYLAENLPESMQKHAANIIRYSPTQVMPSIDIYPKEVHRLFDFREMNLNDVSKFFGEY